MFARRNLLAILLLTMLLLFAPVLAGAEEMTPTPQTTDTIAATVPATLSLEQAIELALVHNPQVGIAQEGVIAIQGQLSQALSLLMPRLDATARRTTPINPVAFQSTETTWETSVNFSQSLYTAGSLQKGVQAAKSALAGSEGISRRTQQQIAFAVRQSYYQILTAEEQEKVAKEVVDSANEHLRVARLRYEAGVAPQFDVLAAEARVARDDQVLIAARSNHDIAWAALSTVIGVPIGKDTQLSTPRPVERRELDLPALTQEALSHRPDLLSVKADAAIAAAQLAIARALRQPTISLDVNYAVRPKLSLPGEVFGGLPGTEIIIQQNSGFIFLTANWSLFNGGQVTGQITTTRARLRQAEKAVEGEKLQITLDVNRAYLLLEAAQAQVEAAQKEVAQAQEAQRIAVLRYQEGVGTSVEILDAQATLGDAKTRLNQAIFGLNLAVAELDLAVGRDWKASQVALEEGA